MSHLNQDIYKRIFRRVLTKDDYPNIQVTKGGAGWFAVMLWWNPDHGGFAEPYETGFGRYLTEEEAIKEAKQWAEAEGIEFIESETASV